MPNDSSTGGYILPTTGPVYDDALDNAFQQFVVGVTGIPGNLVRPRWQPEPPNIPDFTVDWAALGVQVVGGDWGHYEREDPTLFAGKGGVIQERDEAISILVSFYGPHAMANAETFRACCLVQQNMNVLRDAVNINLVGLGEVLQVPALLQQKWLKRCDIKGDFKRRVSRTLPIYSLASASVSLNAENVQTNFTITN